MSNKNNQIYDKLKEELLSIINNQHSEKFEELNDKIKENNTIISESNKIMEENKRIIECFLEQKYQIDKIDNLDKFTKKSNDTLISHEIRIKNNCNEISSIKTKYDKIVLDNLYISGYIGPSCQYKNLSSYLKSHISEFGKVKSEYDNIKKEIKEFKIKLDGASKNIINLIDGGVLRCNQYADNRINDFHLVLENKLNDMNDKMMELRMKNIQFQSKIEEQLDNLKNEYEEKMKKQKDDLSQIINNKIEYLNMNYSSFEKNPKILEIDEIKKNVLQLSKEFKEIKNIYNNNNNIQGENKTKKNKGKANFNEDNVINIFNHTDYNNTHKSNYRIFGSARKSSYLGENNKNTINDFSLNIRKEKNRQIISKGKSKFNKNNTSNSNHKNSSSFKLLNMSKENNNENYNKNDVNNNEILPHKYSTKTNLINIKDKINLIDNIPDNYIENLNIKFNKIKKNNNNNNNIFNKEQYNNDIKNYRYKKDLIKNNNNNNNLETHIINENSDSFISISNSSKQDNIYETTNNQDLKQKTIFINKKKNNRNNVLEKKLITDLINKSEKTHLSFPNKLKNVHLNITENNDLKTNSKKNFNKSQNNIKNEIIKRNEIVNELFSKYNKDKISTNLNLIKNKANLDLYNYSISPPNNKFLLNAKINEIIEPPLKEIFFDKNSIYDKKTKEYYTKRNLTLRPSLNMQLFYGNYNEKKKDKINKIKSLSSSEQKINTNIKNPKNKELKKINPSLGKTIYSEFIKTEDLFTMTTYKTKNI